MSKKLMVKELIDFDKILKTLKKGDLIFLSGYDDIEETELALTLIRSLSGKYNIPIAYFSHGVSASLIALKLLSSEANIDMESIQSATITDCDYQKITEQVGKLSKFPVFIDDSSQITIDGIIDNSRKMKQQNGVQLIIVDDFRLIINDKSEFRQQSIIKMKELAKELDIPIIVILQEE